MTSDRGDHRQPVDVDARSVLLRRGLRLEYATLGWNVVGIGVTVLATVAARAVALAGFSLDIITTDGPRGATVEFDPRARVGERDQVVEDDSLRCDVAGQALSMGSRQRCDRCLRELGQGPRGQGPHNRA